VIRRYILPALGVLGLGAGIVFSMTYGSPQAPQPNQLTLPPSAPFDDTISGTGLVEASSRNIEIGSFASGVVTKVNVKEGDRVAAGDVLFVIDERAAKAELELRNHEVQTAQAAINNARAQLDDVEDQRRRAEQLTVGKSVSVEELQRRRFAVKRAIAALSVAQGEYESAKSAVEVANVTLSRLSVAAPVAGRILKVRVRPGEFVAASNTGEAPILMGEDQPLHLRVAIDENDVWRFQGDVKARASLRSNKEMSYPLAFVRVEPYVQPKRNLNGDATERVDTRVLEVVYRIETGDGLPPLYIGQQMDVFISAK